MLLANRIKKAVWARGGGGGVPTDGLIAHYTMDNISGSTLVDEQGTYDGTITGVTQTPGRFGQALDFNGSLNYVSLGTLPFNSGQDEFSLSFWFSTSSATDQFIICNGVDDGYYFRISADGRVIFKIDDGANDAFQFIGDYNDGLFHHAVCVNTGTSILLYVDNVELYEIAHSVGTFAGFPTYLGIENEAGTGLPRTDAWRNEMSGLMDQLRIYNRALTVSEVDQLYTE